MSLICNQRNTFLFSVVLVAGIAVYAALTAGIVEATAFAPVFIAMYLLERRRTDR